jgi:hypothetical protein
MRAEEMSTTFEVGEAEHPRQAATVIVLSTAELSTCNCPEECERDHDRD